MIFCDLFKVLLIVKCGHLSFTNKDYLLPCLIVSEDMFYMGADDKVCFSLSVVRQTVSNGC